MRYRTSPMGIAHPSAPAKLISPIANPQGGRWLQQGTRPLSRDEDQGKDDSKDRGNEIDDTEPPFQDPVEDGNRR